jgi:hypothetical protein
VTVLRPGLTRIAMATTILAAPGMGAQAAPTGPSWKFVDATTDAGLTFTHANSELPGTPTQRAAGGVAAGDYDRDGDIDLYLVGGDAGTSALFRNRGDGTFEEVAREAGVVLEHSNASGPLFFDFDGDGWLDLFVGATEGEAARLFRNRRDGAFEDVSLAVGSFGSSGAISATAGDYDGDGWPDIFLSHWGTLGDVCHLFRNRHGRSFDCVDDSAGIPRFGPDLLDQTFTANFVDIDADGWVDLLVASDFETSRVLHNRGNGRFEPWETSVISDENGMGSAIGDYDGDGALDWFVSSIRDADGTTEGDWGTTGNRLYRGLGDGTFADVTDAAGVRDGDWGWAACFADLNHDGVLDLVQVNGWPQGSAQFRDTPARLFLGSSEGRFSEAGESLGFVERSGGRGLVCFDYDVDGDIDLLVMNNGAPARLWRNDGGAALGGYLDVELAGPAPNRDGIGALVRVSVGGRAQVRPIRAGSNYVSQDPPTAHFGLGAATSVERLEIRWPDGYDTVLEDVPVNRRLVVERAAIAAQRSPGHGGCSMAPSGVGRRE